jgi:hypothetical protein
VTADRLKKALAGAQGGVEENDGRRNASYWGSVLAVGLGASCFSVTSAHAASGAKRDAGHFEDFEDAGVSLYVRVYMRTRCAIISTSFILVLILSIHS